MAANERTQDVGRELVLSILGVIRTMQTHGTDNDAVNAALRRLSSHVAQNLPQFGGSLQLHVVDDMMLLNGERLRPTPMQAPHFAQFLALFAERALGGIAFTQAASVEALRTFHAIFAQQADNEESARAIRRALAPLEDWGIHTLDLRTLSSQDPQDTLRVSRMAFAIQVYARALLGFREFIDAVKDGRDPYANRLSIVRVVQDLIDVASVRADYLIEIVRLQKERSRSLGSPYSEVHAANTCVYSVLMGRMLRLERTQLLDLGTSALLSDASSALTDETIKNRSAVLSDVEKAHIRDETTRAMQALLGREGNDDAVMLRTIAAYEHRRPVVEPSGAKNALHLVSRIISVASAYDAMTTVRPWRAAMPIPEALANLNVEAGQKYEALVVSTLAAILGKYVSAA
jgi:HD-GYP domain-containing protein (c-di-GMP phosphodiesterase class II)